MSEAIERGWIELGFLVSPIREHLIEIFRLSDSSVFLMCPLYGAFKEWETDLRDPVFQYASQPYRVTVEGFLGWIATACKILHDPLAPYALDTHVNHAGYTTCLTKQMPARQLACATGIDVEIVTQHLRQYLVFHEDDKNGE